MQSGVERIVAIHAVMVGARAGSDPQCKADAVCSKVLLCTPTAANPLCKFYCKSLKPIAILPFARHSGSVEVSGSIPLSSTKSKKPRKKLRGFFISVGYRILIRRLAQNKEDELLNITVLQSSNAIASLTDLHRLHFFDSKH